jgi:hypothetical protein
LKRTRNDSHRLFDTYFTSVSARDALRGGGDGVTRGYMQHPESCIFATFGKHRFTLPRPRRSVGIALPRVCAPRNEWGGRGRIPAPAAARPGSLALATASLSRFCRLAPLAMMPYSVVTEGCRYDKEPRELPPPHHINIPQRGLSPRREALSLAVLKVWRRG